jgi:hypothetical protein
VVVDPQGKALACDELPTDMGRLFGYRSWIASRLAFLELWLLARNYCQDSTDMHLMSVVDWSMCIMIVDEDI